MLDIFRRIGLSRRQSRTRGVAPLVRLTLERLEGRDLPAPLTWSAGINLPSARAGLDAIVETDNSILVLGGNTSRVYQLAANDTAWTTANYIDTSRVSGGVGSPRGSHPLVSAVSARA